jgi:hypothetical protein
VPIVHFKDGTKVIFDWQELVEQAIAYKNSNLPFEK